MKADTPHRRAATHRRHHISSFSCRCSHHLKPTHHSAVTHHIVAIITSSPSHFVGRHGALRAAAPPSATLSSAIICARETNLFKRRKEIARHSLVLKPSRLVLLSRVVAAAHPALRAGRAAAPPYPLNPLPSAIVKYQKLTFILVMLLPSFEP